MCYIILYVYIDQSHLKKLKTSADKKNVVGD